jgi:pimeloyl-ACP methyl ester carboxylesterase
LGVENVPIEFTTGNGWAYDGRIELPAESERNGYAVMMLGGGIGSPIDWAVPGVMTLDGKATHDADTIARALLGAGFVVMRWQAIRRDDPKHAEDPVMMDAPPFPQTIEQAEKAYAAFRAKKLVTDDRIFLLGHSLGARRAAILIERNPKTPGLVMLAGASLLPSDLEAAKSILDTGDDKAHRHEAAVERLGKQAERWSEPFAGKADKYGRRWPADIIAERKTPTLLIVGALDERWLVESYMFTSYVRRARHPDYTWKVYEGLGHQLASEVAGPVEYKEQGVIANSRTGAIEEPVVKELVAWLRERAK